jgi:hypothetical protein
MPPLSTPLTCCLLGLLSLVPAVASAKEAVRVTPETVDEAITRGVDWLLEAQRPDGSFGTGDQALGQTALAVLALQHAGLREEQEGKAADRMRRSLRYIDRQGPGRGRGRLVDPGTYTTALLVLVLRERGRARDRARLQALVDLLVRTQADNGQWWYFGRPGKQAKTGPRTGDNSNTQFALLALGVAQAHGLQVPGETFDRARAWYEASVQTDGGHGYAAGGALRSTSVGSMTAAALACYSVIEVARPRSAKPVPPTPGRTKPPAVQAQAYEWLEKHYSVKRNHGPAKGQAGQRQRKGGRGWLHYYLWTLERAMVLSGVERIGDHDWYLEGAAQLLDTQKKDGSWRGEKPLYATSFALLFLTRAADPPRAFTPRPPDTTAKPTTGNEAQPPAPVQPPTPGDLPPGTLDDWLDAELAPGVLPEWVRRLGARCLPTLVTALQDPEPKRRQRAWEALSAVLPDDVIFRADRHPLARGRLMGYVRRYAGHLELVDGQFRIPK